MITFKLLDRYSFADLSHILTALAKVSYLSGFASLLSAVSDLLDFTVHLFKPNVVLRKVVLKAAASRFFGHALVGLGHLVPIITIGSFMLMSPWFIPLVAIAPVLSDYIKHTKVVKKLKEIVAQQELLFKQEPTLEHLTILREYREKLYKTKQERVISAALAIGAISGAAGLLFQPLLIASAVISISFAILGIIDKKYQYSKRINRFIFANPEIKEDALLKKANEQSLLNPSKNNKVLFLDSYFPKIKALNPNLLQKKPQKKPKNNSRFFKSKTGIELAVNDKTKSITAAKRL